MKTINNEVVILYREDIFSAWTNNKPEQYQEMAYFLRVKGEMEDLYFMLGKPEDSFLLISNE
ncbi:hypothetical protein [Aeromonas phage 4L372XY]|uniref:Uncharacterized protein n=1 Tax=Aeromonas phage 4L372XY TaxID=2588520 RepID=A0A5B9N7B9_9CAUD|nr:hypothetical protein HWC28_gp010 [Aeromonas phage 4L372XY]QEG08725.1 hypothetical protein [Aeromonas phage 4L372XY]